MSKALTVLLELKESASYWSEYDVPIGIHERIEEAILELTAKPEPEAWIIETEIYGKLSEWVCTDKKHYMEEHDSIKEPIPLYTAPPKREALSQVVDSDERASAYMNARLWEFIDMSACFPKAKPDLRIWDHVLIYAPKPERTEQEPVAWMWDDKRNETNSWTRVCCTRKPDDSVYVKNVAPLYTTPPKREPLSESEIAVIWGDSDYDVAVVRRIEKAHGIGGE